MLATRLRLKWRPQLGLRAVALTVYAPKYGTVRLVVTRNRGRSEGRRQRRVHREQCLGGGPDHPGGTQAEPLEHRDDLSRYQAVCRVGGVPVLGRLGDGASRRHRPPHLRRSADAETPSRGAGGRRQRALAAGGCSQPRLPACPAQGLSIRSQSDRVSPVSNVRRHASFMRPYSSTPVQPSAPHVAAQMAMGEDVDQLVVTSTPPADLGQPQRDAGSNGWHAHLSGGPLQASCLHPTTSTASMRLSCVAVPQPSSVVC